MLRLLIITVCLSVTAGCAAFNRENTRALNFIQAKLIPEDPLAKKLTYPVTIPTSIVAVTVDMLLLHPASVLPDAVDDARKWAWNNLNWREQYFTTAASIVPRAAWTPVAFTGSLLARSVFDISPPKPPEIDKEKETDEQTLRNAQKALQEGRTDEALRLAQAIAKKRPLPAARDIIAATLLEKGEIEQLSSERGSFRWNDDIEKRFIRAIRAASPENRIRLLFMIERGTFWNIHPSGDFLEVVVDMLQDNDRAVKMKALTTLGRFISTPSVVSALKEIAMHGDPVLAAEAKMRLPK